MTSRTREGPRRVHRAPRARLHGARPTRRRRDARRPARGSSSSALAAAQLPMRDTVDPRSTHHPVPPIAERLAAGISRRARCARRRSTQRGSPRFAALRSGWRPSPRPGAPTSAPASSARPASCYRLRSRCWCSTSSALPARREGAAPALGALRGPRRSRSRRSRRARFVAEAFTPRDRERVQRIVDRVEAHSATSSPARPG